MQFGRRQVVAGALGAAFLQRAALAANICPPSDPSYHPFPFPTPVICNAFVNPKDLSISPQQNSEWCWAATIHNIFSYHGHDVDQSAIVAAGIGQVANKPGDMLVMQSVLNRMWTDNKGNKFLSQSAILHSSDLGMFPPSNDFLINDLNNDNPLLVCNMSHAMMLISVNYVPPVPLPHNVVQAIVIDPWPGYGIRSLSQAELMPYPAGQMRLALRISVT